VILLEIPDIKLTFYKTVG